MSAEVELRDVVKTYGPTRAIDGVSLSVGKGELLALLGPSGCGKTTTLRAIAGFVEPTSGAILLRGRDVTRLAPHRRDTGMVFQSYALFPHLSVRENLAFGLKRRGLPGAEIRSRTDGMIALLRLDGLAERLPRELSGGQQQRVAVGRALVVNPTVLLLDEPFSNLDALLREATRVELRRLQQDLGITAILVTHDQAEAMAIADRIAVMDKGRIVQIDRPTALYRRPVSRFVAEFVGRANVVEATRRDAGGRSLLVAAGLELAPAAGTALPDRCIAVLRPEAISLAAGHAAPAPNSVSGTVDFVAYLGSVAQIVVVAPQVRLLVEGPGELIERFGKGAPVTAHWPAEAIAICPAG
jgi:putative spermidine/putrescine transport system ATP-binding protein